MEGVGAEIAAALCGYQAVASLEGEAEEGEGVLREGVDVGGEVVVDGVFCKEVGEVEGRAAEGAVRFDGEGDEGALLFGGEGGELIVLFLFTFTSCC